MKTSNGARQTLKTSAPSCVVAAKCICTGYPKLTRLVTEAFKKQLGMMLKISGLDESRSIISHYTCMCYFSLGIKFISAVKITAAEI